MLFRSNSKLVRCHTLEAFQNHKDEKPKPNQNKKTTKNIGRTLYDINHSKIIFDPAPKEMEIKIKINKWNLMKLKSFAQQRKI